MAGEKLSNAYVKGYYDAQVEKLSSYTDDRWHSSPVQEFEYNQTLRSLKKALSGRMYTNALEIGPGDAVWTPIIKPTVEGNLHLIEQSQEMLDRAKVNLTSLPGITFEHADFLQSQPPGNNDLIIAVRCFEYFEDKEGALKKMRTLLVPGGQVIIVTKNADLMTSTPVQHHTLHSDQLSRKEMQRLAREAGFVVEYTYPAILRWKAKYALLRTVFDVIHRVTVATKGRVSIPFINTYAAESYVYVLQSPRV